LKEVDVTASKSLATLDWDMLATLDWDIKADMVGFD
jgi:hypothetical protein